CMKSSDSIHLRLVLACLMMGGVLIGSTAFAQPATQPQGAAGRRGGRGAIPNATPAQNAVLSQMNADLAPLTEALANVRRELLAISLALPRDDSAINSKVQAVKTAELALANARAGALAKIQSSSDKLAPVQIASLNNAVPAGRGGGSPANGGIPNMTSNQVSALMQLTGTVQQATQSLATARTELAAASFADPRDDAAITAKVEAIGNLELQLANIRADGIAKIQSSPEKLSPDQLAALVVNNGVIVSGSFSEPQPIDFNDHVGYVSLFDGTSLKGWDGNPKFWRVEDGAMVGESTPQNPSGNTYIAYRDIEAHDFTLKCEIKIEGAGGTGIQYRSKTGIPWLTAVQPNVIANAGPTNLNWMMTGPQADFWPSRDTTAKYSGQFYSENTPMRIMAWRGQVVEGYGMSPRRLMANIGDRTEMAKFIKQNDWNEYTIIARGPTFIHIINGQLMSVMIDDDPTSSNNWTGQIGIEIEATTKVSVRNVWLKKLN
ncbi:MAG TPA: DUF1080 domain-containing protein, partial [Tepidisphaeraceae bacterium]|nr:DUF1080 domain-containing protein [Tepidisphaeraceae bacterium]